MRHGKGVLMAAGLIVILAIPVGCAKKSEEVLAVVEGQKLTTQEFQNALATLPEDYKVLAETEKGKHKIFENIIMKNLLVLEAESRAYQHQPEVKAKIKELKEKSRALLQKQLEELQYRLAHIERQAYENILVGELYAHLKKEGLPGVTISDAEIDAYYQDYARKMKILNPSAAVPELATVKPQIEAILIEGKLIQQLRQKHKVEVKEDLFQKLYGSKSSEDITIEDNNR